MTEAELKKRDEWGGSIDLAKHLSKSTLSIKLKGVDEEQPGCREQTAGHQAHCGKEQSWLNIEGRTCMGT